jgi:hypothetical protein
LRGNLRSYFDFKRIKGHITIVADGGVTTQSLLVVGRS